MRWRDTVLPEWASPEDRFVLSEVAGHSLADVGINAGDFVLIHITTDIEDGDLIAATTSDGEYLIKFISYLSEDRVSLKGASDLDRPRIFPANTINIEGRVVRKEPA